jgi:hypothetical protein
VCAAVFAVPVVAVVAVSLALRGEYRASALIAYRFPGADRDAVRLWGLRPQATRSGLTLPDSVLAVAGAPSGSRLGPLHIPATRTRVTPVERTVSATAEDRVTAIERADGFAHATVRSRGKAVRRLARRAAPRSGQSRELQLLAGIEAVNVVVKRRASADVTSSRHPVRDTLVALVLGAWLAGAVGFFLGARRLGGQVAPADPVAP